MYINPTTIIDQEFLKDGREHTIVSVSSNANDPPVKPNDFYFVGSADLSNQVYAWVAQLNASIADPVKLPKNTVIQPPEAPDPPSALSTLFGVVLKIEQMKRIVNAFGAGQTAADADLAQLINDHVKDYQTGMIS